MLLVSDGNRVVCLNKSGEVAWSFESKRGETFMTQPVLDSVGNVYVATDKSIIALK
jgi:outer membrane protein assembly factor BamB